MAAPACTPKINQTAYSASPCAACSASRILVLRDFASFENSKIDHVPGKNLILLPKTESRRRWSQTPAGLMRVESTSRMSLRSIDSSIPRFLITRRSPSSSTSSMYSECRCLVNLVAIKPVINPLKIVKNNGMAFTWDVIRRVNRPATPPKIIGKTFFPKNVAAEVSFFIFFWRTSRCGTGYRERHSATGLRVVVKRIISTRGG